MGGNLAKVETLDEASNRTADKSLLLPLKKAGLGILEQYFSWFRSLRRTYRGPTWGVRAVKRTQSNDAELPATQTVRNGLQAKHILGIVPKQFIKRQDKAQVPSPCETVDVGPRRCWRSPVTGWHAFRTPHPAPSRSAPHLPINQSISCSHLIHVAFNLCRGAGGDGVQKLSEGERAGTLGHWSIWGLGGDTGPHGSTT